LLRSGTSSYPNHGEAQAAEFPKDFIAMPGKPVIERVFEE